MKNTAVVLIASLALLGTCEIAAAQSGHVCVYTNDDNTVLNAVDGYLVTPSSQAYLAPVQTGGTAFTPSEIVPDIVIHPSKDIVYVANSRTSSIAAMKIAPATCQLTVLGDFTVGERSKLGQGLAVSPDGKWMFVSNTTVNEIYVFGILADGSLTGRLQMVALHGIPGGMTVSQDGTTLIVEKGVSQRVLSYSINDSTGHLTPVSAISTVNYPSESVVDPFNKYVYVGDVDSAELGYEEVEILKVGPGSILTYIANDTFSEGNGASGEFFSADGKYLYVTNEFSATITTLSINSSNGGLTYVASTNDGTAGEDYPAGLVGGRNGTFLFTVARGQQNTIGILEADKSGVLTSVGIFPITADNKYALIGEFDDGPQAEVQVGIYAINPDGSLGAYNTFYNLGPAVNADFLWLSPDERFLYVSGDGGPIAAVTTLNFDESVPQLTPTGCFVQSERSDSGLATALPTDSGSLLYQGLFDAQAKASVALYQVNSSTGCLTEVSGSPFSTGREGAAVSVAAWPPRPF